MPGIDQSGDERRGAQDVGVHDQQIVVEGDARQPQRIQAATAVLIVRHIADRQPPVLLANRRADQLLLVAHHHSRRFDAPPEQGIEISDEQ